MSPDIPPAWSTRCGTEPTYTVWRVAINSLIADLIGGAIGNRQPILVCIERYIFVNNQLTGSANVMDTDSDSSSPHPLTAFKAVPWLVSASALRGAPRTPDSPSRHSEICSPTISHEASLTHTVPTPPGLDGADGVNVRASPVRSTGRANADRCSRILVSSVKNCGDTACDLGR